MKKIYIIMLILLILVCFLYYGLNEETEKNKFGKNNMELSSSSFENDGKIPSKYTCDGENINPPLKISDVPEQAKTLVLIMDDPDAVKPAGKIWDHWIVFNIPVDTKEINENTSQIGIYGINSFGNTNYGGPCPPDTEHSYYFKLYALDKELELEKGATKNQVEQAMQNNILAQTKLIGKYERK